MEKNELEKYFRYLDKLRASGVTNMFGAWAYLQKNFSIPREESSEVCSLWMNTFDPEKTPKERANAAAEGRAEVTPGGGA